MVHKCTVQQCAYNSIATIESNGRLWLLGLGLEQQKPSVVVMHLALNMRRPFPSSNRDQNP